MNWGVFVFEPEIQIIKQNLSTRKFIMNGDRTFTDYPQSRNIGLSCLELSEPVFGKLSSYCDVTKRESQSCACRKSM